MLSSGGLIIDDDDHDATTDPDLQEERGETLTVGGQPADFSGYLNANNAAVADLTPNAIFAGLAFSGIGVGIAGLFGIKGKFVGGAILAAEAYAFYSAAKQWFASQDPYDPNYHSLYVPISPALPILPDGPGLPAGLRADGLSFMQASASVASYADALYVTENRMLSAIHDGDLASFQLQNTQLNRLSLLLGEAHSALAQTETTWATDLVDAGVNASITQAQMTSYINQLKTQGVSALPADERAILNSFTTNPAEQQAILNTITSLSLPAAPTDLVSALKFDANTNKELS